MSSRLFFENVFCKNASVYDPEGWRSDGEPIAAMGTSDGASILATAGCPWLGSGFVIAGEAAACSGGHAEGIKQTNWT